MLFLKFELIELIWFTHLINDRISKSPLIIDLPLLGKMNASLEAHSWGPEVIDDYTYIHGIPTPIYDQPSAWLSICKYNWNCTPEFLQLWLLLEKAWFSRQGKGRMECAAPRYPHLTMEGRPEKHLWIDILSTWLIGGGVNFIQQPIGSICQWKCYCQMKLNPSSFAVEARPPVL